MTDEKIWRCDCGNEAVGVSFYTWKDEPGEWFIEVYKLGGVASRTWRWKRIWDLLLGRDIYVEAVALDFLASSVAEAEAKVT